MDAEQRAAILDLSDRPEPRAEDVASPEAIVRAVYGFYEREIARDVDRFGHIAQVFSTYESRVGSDDGEPVARGINSVQVVHAENRWWIAHLVWDVERPDDPIPGAYLQEE